ncbi:LacI family DNA-binding transcriptional regulator [Corynebacterium sp. SCR221107]|uniref:LacI family DNA-binding transcriptional regulator n=1 Tax=Corynebacterium sp. SCR221107 TaxID=3017361 RepID=UPI0022EC47EF|nr:LacI family DNA-binding transcriptional regulator [Corynebacterium sp. SCR221107]WBT08369.1 LacI family DNA-binding transcriptional regulator [Corynebacterium sp. SCR221107]
MSKRAKRTSLASLAKELGVSRTTVSNAYNHPEQLSARLREKILETAERMGYPGPDPTARSLRTKRVGAVGVLLTEHLTYAFEDLASVDFLAGMAEASYGSQTSLTLVPVGPNTTDVLSARQLVNSAVVDGFVVYSVAKDDPYLVAARTRGLPIVICDQPADDLELPFVGIDDRAAIGPAAQALVDAGHTKIGILCIRLDTQPNNGPVSAERLENAHHHVQRSRVLGALDVFGNAGIDPADVPIVERHINDPENNIDAARELLEQNPELTAVLCTTDTMALGVIGYTKSQGISVPEQLSVTGFDGIAPALTMGLSTVIQPNKDKGKHAGRMLASLLNTGDEAVEGNQRVLLEYTYNEGTTVAAPRA